MSYNTNPQNEANPVVEFFCGIPIRKYNQVTIRLDTVTYKELLRTEMETGLSQRQIIGYSSKPCNCCTGTFVRVLGKEDKEVKIIRGILSKRINDGWGSSKKDRFKDCLPCQEPLK